MYRPKRPCPLLLLALLLLPALVFPVMPASSATDKHTVSQSSSPATGHDDPVYDNDDDADDNDGNKGACGKQGDRIRFVVPLPGIQSSIWPDGSVSMSIPLQNTSENLAGGVKLTEVKVPDGTRIMPSPLPLAIGDILPDEIKKVDARFRLRRTGMKYPVILRGSYDTAEGRCKFHVRSFFTPQEEDNRPVTAKTGSVQKVSVNTAVFPPEPPALVPEREFNGVGLLPPLGPPQDFFPVPPSATMLNRTAAFNLMNAGQPVPLNPDLNIPPNPIPDLTLGISPLDAEIDPRSVVFTRNTVGATYGGFPPDPSVAGNNQNDVAMFTANTAVSYSTNSGLSFKTVNLVGLYDPANLSRTSFFPQDDGGVCCDQVLHYVPKRNLFVWLLQYRAAQVGTDSAGKPITGPNRLRIAWATPQDIKSNFLYAWTWVDLTSAGVGLGNDWMDYPDLAYSDNFVYVGVDHGIANTGSVWTGRHIFARLSLDDIVNPAIPYVTYWYMDPSRGGLWQNHVAQSSNDAMYWTAMPNTSTLTVYHWPDNSGTATLHDVPITNFSNSNYKALTPEGIEWEANPKMVLGATRVDPFFFCPDTGCTGPTRFLYFAFSAGQNPAAGRPYPYVRVEKVDLDTFTRVSEMDIWNAGFAFSMPALQWRPGNYNDEVAVSLAIGGGGNFADNAVGFLGDYVVYVTTDSDTTHAGYARDNNGKIILDGLGQPTYSVRFGDYYSLRDSIGPMTANGRGLGYSTLSYASKTLQAGKKCVDVGCRIDEHYVQFGRYGELFPNPPPPPPR